MNSVSKLQPVKLMPFIKQNVKQKVVKCNKTVASDGSVIYCQTIKHHIPEILHSHCHEYGKPHTILPFLFGCIGRLQTNYKTTQTRNSGNHKLNIIRVSESTGF